MTAHKQSSTQQIIQRHDDYMSINYGRYPIAMVKGLGCTLEDADGKQYLDLFAGFGGPILGHCHPDLVEAVTEQAKTLWHVGNLFHTEPQTRLAEHISKHGFGGRSFFCHSGADANEAAIKLARLFGKANPGKATDKTNGRYKIICCNNAFHGRTFGTMVATSGDKARQGFEPLLTGFSHVAFNDLSAIENAVDEDTVAVMLEPIQGEGGVHVPDDNFLPRLRAFCDERNLLLICDEVWTGCGRTGQYFAHQHWDIDPDIMTLAKGAGGGLPVGVMCAKPELAELYDARKHGVKHATTLGGNCLSMAVGARIFDVIERDALLTHANAMQHQTISQVQAFMEAKPGYVRDVRGRGLFIGIDLDFESGKIKHAAIGDVVKAAMAKGILVNGTQNTVLRIAPPLVVEGNQLQNGIDALLRIIADG